MRLRASSMDTIVPVMDTLERQRLMRAGVLAMPSSSSYLIRFRSIRLSIAVGKMNVSIGGGHNTLNLIALSSNTVGMIGEGNFNLERCAIQIG